MAETTTLIEMVPLQTQTRAACRGAARRRRAATRAVRRLGIKDDQRLKPAGLAVVALLAGGLLFPIPASLDPAASTPDPRMFLRLELLLAPAP